MLSLLVAIAILEIGLYIIFGKRTYLSNLLILKTAVLIRTTIFLVKICSKLSRVNIGVLVSVLTQGGHLNLGRRYLMHRKNSHIRRRILWRRRNLMQYHLDLMLLRHNLSIHSRIMHRRNMLAHIYVNKYFNSSLYYNDNYYKYVL